MPTSRRFQTGGRFLLQVVTANLRRGSAGFPTGRKWQICHDAPGQPKYVICNGDEWPVGPAAIEIEDRGDKRFLHTWNTTVELHACPECGRFFAPEPTAFLKEMLPEAADVWGLCPECQRHRAARQWLEVSG